MRRLLIGTVMALFLIAVALPTGAATAFATPAFQTQWQQGEALTPNFWGPLANAKEGQQEPYVEAPGGKRLVQYFDKGRMELTDPASGIVTNGLLATDLFKGQVQVGDTAFQAKPSPAVPIAGDLDNPGPTYAGLASNGASLFAPATAKPGSFVTLLAAADGSVTDGGGFAGISLSPAISGFDATTQHNILGVFADYRNRVGLPSIGLAISEPFRTNVKVAGTSVTVLAQVFERRVLTYTDTNPDPFKVEMGNIGLAYYLWLYSGSATTAAVAATTTAPTAVPTTVPAQPAATASPQASANGGGLSVAFVNITSPVAHGSIAKAGIKTAPGAMCTIAVTYQSGPSQAKGLEPATANAAGGAVWAWTVDQAAAPGNWPVAVTCTLNGQSATQQMNFTVT